MFIRTYPNKALSNPTQEVSLDKSLASAKRSLAKMHECLHKTTGVGLAAPQVGLGLQMFVWGNKLKDDEGNVISGSIINPEIVEVSDETTSVVEGCLSLPNRRFQIQRPKYIKIRGYDQSGNQIDVSFGEGLPGGILGAQMISHEMDHLDGLTLLDTGQELNVK